MQIQYQTVRLPSSTEWNKLMAITNKLDTTHWKSIGTWCLDTDGRQRCVMRGNLSPCYWHSHKKHDRFPDFGFRPAFEINKSDAANIPDGEILPIATMYVDNQPVKIPKNPVWDLWHGDIPDFVPGSKIEFRNPLNDPDYQISAIKIKNILIADRVLLKKISWVDLAEQGFCKTGNTSKK